MGSEFAPMLMMHLDAGNRFVVLTGSTLAVSSCSARNEYGRSATSKGRSSPSPGWDGPRMSSSPAWWRMSVWIPARTSTGSHIHQTRRSDSSPQGRSTRTSASRQTRRNSGRNRSATWWSTAVWTGLGPILLLHGVRQPGVRPPAPSATKRALRAILKAVDLCALEPERAARFLVDKGRTVRYDYAFQTMKDVPYPSGATTTPKTRCVFTACASMRPG